MIKTVYTIENDKEVIAYIPNKVSYTALENLYDVCNEIFADYSDCFYTKTEVSKLKKDPSNKFLREGAEQ